MKREEFYAHAFMLRRIWQHNKVLFLLTALRIPLEVLNSFLNIYLTSIIVGSVMLGRIDRLLKVLFCFSVLKLILSLVMHLSEKMFANKNYSLRMQFIYDYAKKYMQTDYINIESAEGKNQAQRAKNTMFGFDYRAKPVVEAYLIHISTMLGQLFGIVAYGGIISVLNPLILIILLITAGTTYIFQKCMVSYDRKDRLVYVPIERKIHYLMREAKNFKSAKDVKMYGLSNWFTDIFHDQIEQRIKLYKKRGRVSLLLRSVIVLVNMVFNGFVYMYLIYQYLNNGLDIQSFILYFGMITGFNTWLLNFIGSVEGLQRFTFHIEDLRNFLTDDKTEMQNNQLSIAENDDCAKHENHASDIDSYIVFDNVSYKYSENREHTINNISFQIKKGEKIAVVGVNGAGKTTLIKLLCGLYTPTSGEIRIANKDINKMNRHELFRKFAVVFQDIYMLPTSVERNIALEREIDKAKLHQVLQLSGLEDKIKILPEREKTILLKSVREEAIELSGGETQKLALARALYKDGEIMVLDEPTAALDPVAESDMYKRYSRLTEGKTSIFISHRLSSTRFCDRILFMKNGVIAECGTHDELMELQGQYAEMYQIQSRYYRQGGTEF